MAELKGSRLATIQAVSTFEVMKKSYPCDCWLGGSDKEREGAWYWYDVNGQDTKASISTADAMWIAGDPNDKDGSENCLSFGYYGGNWGTIDSPCTWLRAFLCQITLKGKTQKVRVSIHV